VTNSGQVTVFRAHEAKRDRAYLPSYDFGAATLGDRHERIGEAVWHIPGWLEPEDALKLYELAWFARGPVLEIGTYCGRSAVIMAIAVADRGGGIPVISLDTDPAVIPFARRAAQAHGLLDHVLFACTTVDTFLSAIPSFSPAFVFVDGDHSAAGVEADLHGLEGRVAPGGLLLFHDYVEQPLPRTDGFPVSAEPIDVQHVVERSWVAEQCEFAGTFGCSALFRVPDPDPAAQRPRTATGREPPGS
jgi:MMP 1-O-methyltransferase